MDLLLLLMDPLRDLNFPNQQPMANHNGKLKGLIIPE